MVKASRNLKFLVLCFFTVIFFTTLSSYSYEPSPSLQKCTGGSLTGVVTKVSDGDSLTFSVWGCEPLEVRLASIDAPELGQPFGAQAKRALTGLVLKETVTISIVGKDRYDRTLGFAWIGDVSVNYEMVKLGYAWHYKRYSADEILDHAESLARESGLGLWQRARPLPPWEYRLLDRER